MSKTPLDFSFLTVFRLQSRLSALKWQINLDNMFVVSQRKQETIRKKKKKEIVFCFRNGKGGEKTKYCSVGHSVCHIYFASSIETLDR